MMLTMVLVALVSVPTSVPQMILPVLSVSRSPVQLVIVVNVMLLSVMKPDVLFVVPLK